MAEERKHKDAPREVLINTTYSQPNRPCSVDDFEAPYCEDFTIAECHMEIHTNGFRTQITANVPDPMMLREHFFQLLNPNSDFCAYEA